MRPISHQGLQGHGKHWGLRGSAPCGHWQADTIPLTGTGPGLAPPLTYTYKYCAVCPHTCQPLASEQAPSGAQLAISSSIQGACKQGNTLHCIPGQARLYPSCAEGPARPGSQNGMPGVADALGVPPRAHLQAVTFLSQLDGFLLHVPTT